VGSSRELIHDLRNALNSILFAVEFLPHGDAESVDAALDIIERQAAEGEQTAEMLELLEAE
jgi:hypothetical protein